MLQYGRSDSYRVATTQDKDEKESPKKKGGKDLDDLKKEVPIVSTLRLITSSDLIVFVMQTVCLFTFVEDKIGGTRAPAKSHFKTKLNQSGITKALKSQLSSEEFIDSVSWPHSSIQRATIQL